MRCFARWTAESLRQGPFRVLSRTAGCLLPCNESPAPETWMTGSLRTSRVHECPTKRWAAVGPRVARRNETVTLDTWEDLTAERVLTQCFQGCGVWHASRHTHVPDTHNPQPLTNPTHRGRLATVTLLSRPRVGAA